MEFPEGLAVFAERRDSETAADRLVAYTSDGPLAAADVFVGRGNDSFEFWCLPHDYKLVLMPYTIEMFRINDNYYGALPGDFFEARNERESRRLAKAATTAGLWDWARRHHAGRVADLEQCQRNLEIVSEDALYVRTVEIGRSKTDAGSRHLLKTCLATRVRIDNIGIGRDKPGVSYCCYTQSERIEGEIVALDDGVMVTRSLPVKAAAGYSKRGKEPPPFDLRMPSGCARWRCTARNIAPSREASARSWPLRFARPRSCGRGFAATQAL